MFLFNDLAPHHEDGTTSADFDDIHTQRHTESCPEGTVLWRVVS